MTTTFKKLQANAELLEALVAREFSDSALSAVTASDALETRLNYARNLYDREILPVMQDFVRRAGEKVLGPNDEMVPKFGNEMMGKIATLSERVKRLGENLDTATATRVLPAMERLREAERALAKRLRQEQEAREEEERREKERREAEEARVREEEARRAALASVVEAERIRLAAAKVREAAMRADLAEEEMKMLRAVPRGMTSAEFLIASLRAATVTNTSVLRELKAVLTNVVAHPENEAYRTLRTDNKFVASLLSHEGAKKVLYALGFTPLAMTRARLEEIARTSTSFPHPEGNGAKDTALGEGLEGEVLVYRLDEPNVEREFDRWDQWYNDLKRGLALLS